ncbi:MAG: hypothetical protein WA691_06105 [Thermoplasmata archaeon]
MNCYNCGTRLLVRANDCPACGAPRPIASTSALDGVPEWVAAPFREVVLRLRSVETVGDELLDPLEAVRTTTRISSALPRRARNATRRLLAKAKRTGRLSGHQLRTGGRAFGRRADSTAHRMTAQSRSLSRKINGARHLVGQRVRTTARKTKEALHHVDP